MGGGDIIVKGDIVFKEFKTTILAFKKIYLKIEHFIASKYLAIILKKFFPRVHKNCSTNTATK